ncbi:MAG: hypothetical protein ABFQ64_00255 [Campylobacterota bacterium]
MFKVYLLTAFLFAGCSNIEFSATMCDEIASDPHATMPQECRNYSEKEAEKAFNKTKDEKKVSDQDIKFDKEENE